MFCALARQAVDTEGLRFELVADGIQSLNERAERAEFDVTALSLHAYAMVSDCYRLTSCGASLGEGYGPVVVSRRPLLEGLPNNARVLVPGERTTALLALRLWAPGVETEVMPFDEILLALVQGRAEIGLLIHEGQVTYAEHGLHRVVDLGEWWGAESSGLPLPLGVNAVRRALPEEQHLRIQRVLRRSIEWGLKHRAEALEYARRFGRGIHQAANERFVSMYVTDLTVDLGERGREAIRAFLERASRAGLLPAGVPLDFVPHTVR
ncbi:MAG: ABC transporter substrate-binding protein [Planctomycetes bacterium]|nr:ABC transporter substrate-binding protein [Planctomycetota bacterium]